MSSTFPPLHTSTALHLPTFPAMLTTFQGEVGFPFPAFAFSTHLEVLRTTASNAQTVEQEADCRSGVWSESVEFAMLL